MPSVRLREALRALGPYFTVELPSDLAGWQPVSALIASPEPLLRRAAVVREALGGNDVPQRVALSVAQLGIVARLLAPSFGAAVLEGRLLDPYGGWWRPEVGGPMPLALADEDLARPVVEGDLASAVYEHVVDRVVAPLVGHAAEQSLSTRVLWGNVASAVTGAASMVAQARPALAVHAIELATGLLHRGSLRGTVETVTEVPGVTGVRFRRRSCCLLYTLVSDLPRNVCGDCVLLGVNRNGLGE